MNPRQQVADLALAAPPYHGSAIRKLILDLMRDAPTFTDAVAQMKVVAGAATTTLANLELELAVLTLKGLDTPLEAAAWFIENVPLDASWRSDAFFILRERLRSTD